MNLLYVHVMFPAKSVVFVVFTVFLSEKDLTDSLLLECKPSKIEKNVCRRKLQYVLSMYISIVLS